MFFYCKAERKAKREQADTDLPTDEEMEKRRAEIAERRKAREARQAARRAAAEAGEGNNTRYVCVLWCSFVLFVL